MVWWALAAAVEHQRGELVLAAGTDGDGVATGRQGERGRLADAGRGTGDDRRATVGPGVLLASHRRGAPQRSVTVIGRCAKPRTLAE